MIPLPPLATVVAALRTRAAAWIAGALALAIAIGISYCRGKDAGAVDQRIVQVKHEERALRDTAKVIGRKVDSAASTTALATARRQRAEAAVTPRDLDLTPPPVRALVETYRQETASLRLGNDLLREQHRLDAQRIQVLETRVQLEEARHGVGWGKLLVVAGLGLAIGAAAF